MVHPTDNAAALVLARVTAGYSSRVPPVLDQVSVHVPTTGLFRLCGANGAGKSTVIELASGYLTPWSGQVTVCGVDAASADARSRRRVCRTTPALYPVLTVEEHLDVACRARGSSLGEAIARADTYGLTPWLGREVRELSTGNLRKLWFIVCTLGDFSLALLDEPFNGLDDVTRHVMGQEITTWSEHRAVVVVAHEPPPALARARDILLAPPRHLHQDGEAARLDEVRPSRSR